jgi:N-acetylneuraminic acid mutarotase
MPAAQTLGARSRPASVWTGKELLVWGGADFSTPYPYHAYADGAAFDPSTGAWSEPLPRAPIDARQPFAVWTGTEMIVWGSQDREQRRVDGAAYDPASNTWRRIADAPVELTDATAVWTGEEMIVFGAALHGGNHAETSSAIGIAYDPAADSWRELPDSNLDTNANDAIWIGDGLLAWDYNLDSQIYDPMTDRWSEAGKVPTDECEDVPTSVWAGVAYGKLCGDLVRFDPGSGTWEHIDAPAMFPSTIYGAGDTLLVGGVNGTTGEGEDWRLFAYRPKA